jgi:hypothetical protein
MLMIFNTECGFSEMGAKYKGDWDWSCTHLICAFPNTPKFNQVGVRIYKLNFRLLVVVFPFGYSAFLFNQICKNLFYSKKNVQIKIRKFRKVKIKMRGGENFNETREEERGKHGQKDAKTA